MGRKLSFWKIALCSSLGLPNVVASQENPFERLYPDIPSAEALSQGTDLLSQIVEGLNELPSDAQDFNSETECLGALQLALNSGALAANFLPFSTVYQSEDERGPVGRIRALVGGEKLHLEFFCQENSLRSRALTWDVGPIDETEYRVGTFDAAAGAVLVAALRGWLEGAQFPETSATLNEEPSAMPPGDGPSRINPVDPVSDAVTDALSEALIGSSQTHTDEERLAFDILDQARRCWNVGALGTDAMQVVVTVGMDMSRDGTPSNLRLVTHTGGSATAADRAYDTARRAILRCAPFDLPQDRYTQWRQIEMTFNPAEMGRR